MRKRRLLFHVAWVIPMLASIATKAQNQLIVTLTNGQTDAFNVSEVRSIKFVNNSMYLTEIDGSQSIWNIVDILEYGFSGANSMPQTAQSTGSQLKIFPNPVSDYLSIEYWSLHEGKITIELLDLSGKVVRSVFEGTHQGNTIYTWIKDLPNGTYLCRIASKSKCITKPFIIN